MRGRGGRGREGVCGESGGGGGVKYFFSGPKFPPSNFLRHVMRAIWSVRPKCSHRCVSLKETPLKPVQSLKHTTKDSAEQTAMRTKWFKHIAILNCSRASPSEGGAISLHFCHEVLRALFSHAAE